ncbi:GNAT family protein [uncultured Enterococcus sp.]|uniref:GNAT family N-acetyltransferase n=1 Tax=uncultured Enterococcus sp. TaxID=167972 RepID=UPI002AA73883|nr:GNAT family protein [uncultured Enterococcus sp.]
MTLTHTGTQTIYTSRLTLRPFKHEDNAAMRKNWIANPAIQKMYSEPIYTTETETAILLDKWIDSYANKNFYRWAICLKETNECIGQIAYFLVDDTNHFGEIEYCIGEAFQNQGLMTEAVTAILHYGFEQLHLNKVQVCHKSTNMPSQRVIEKSGFVYEGKLREFFYIDGAYVDRLYYSMLRKEWADLQETAEL